MTPMTTMIIRNPESTTMPSIVAGLALAVVLAAAPLVAAQPGGKPARPAKQPPEPPAVAPTAPPADGMSLDLGAGLSMLFAHIPAGTFLMGSPEAETGRSTDEGPQHEVTISRPFFMGMLPVTQAQFEQVMGFNPSVTAKGGDFPVENVRWEQAVEFCQRLSQRTGKTVRLPTEAEFEYATRAGTTTRYFYGADAYDIRQLGAYTWSFKDCKNQLQPVGRKRPNPWGLHDTYGMVWQWCSDWYADEYPAGTQTDPQGPETGTERVLRGGSWCVGPHTDEDKVGRMLPRSAVRGVTGTWYKWPPPGSAEKLGRGYDQVGRIGFRVVVEAPAR